MIIPKITLILPLQFHSQVIKKTFSERPECNPFIFELPKHKGSGMTDTLVLPPPKSTVLDLCVVDKWSIDFFVENVSINPKTGIIEILAETTSIEVQNQETGKFKPSGINGSEKERAKYVLFLRALFDAERKTGWENPEDDISEFLSE
jgi:hypothetical protein